MLHTEQQKCREKDVEILKLKNKLELPKLKESRSVLTQTIKSTNVNVQTQTLDDKNKADNNDENSDDANEEKVYGTNEENTDEVVNDANKDKDTDLNVEDKNENEVEYDKDVDKEKEDDDSSKDSADEEEKSDDETDNEDENKDDGCCPDFKKDRSHCCHQLVPDVPAEPPENDCHSCGRLTSPGEAILACKFCGRADKCSECIKKENKNKET